MSRSMRFLFGKRRLIFGALLGNPRVRVWELEQKPEELTDEQAKALLKFAKALILSIRSEAPNKRVKPFIPK